MTNASLISLAALAVALSIAGPVAAQDASPIVSDRTSDNAEFDESLASEQIIVTGTRRTDRTVTESAVPVDVFTAQDLATQPSPNLQTIIKNLVPSFNQQRNAGADGTAFVRPPTLRGLPPDQILVLINGKRMHRSALVQVAGDDLSTGSQGPDLSQIPSVALGRVEVLRDGAAAQYGSDAIAGVINLGLRQDADGIELNARYGQSYEGDGEDIQISGNIGLALGEGFLNISGEYVDQSLFNRAIDRPDSAALRELGIDVPFPPTRYGQPEQDAYRVVVNSAVPFGDMNELYFFGNYGYADSEVDFNYRRPVAVTVPGAVPFPGQPQRPDQTFGKSVGTIYLDPIPGLLTAGGAPVYDAGGATFEASAFFPDGFVPLFMSTNEDVYGVIGVRGETDFGMLFDLSAATGQDRIRYTMNETLNPSLGPTSPTDFYLGSLTQQETNFNLDVSYPLEVGFASALNIAGGLEFRRETYKVGLGDPESYAIGPYATQTVQRADGTRFQATAGVGANGFPGYGPDSVADGSRNSYSAYVDVEADIVEAFTLGVAGRYDHFSDFGDTVNGKISARYAFSDAIALRGAASTGFRAPTPGQSFTSNVQTGFPNGSTVPVATATVTPGSVTGEYFGSQPLSPEKSTSFSGGVVLTPMPTLTFTIDYYNIEVRDRIAITSPFQVSAADQAALSALGVANAFDLGQVNYFTNGFETRTQGVDAVLTHRVMTGFGTFNSSLAVNYNNTEVTGISRPEAISGQRAANIEGLTPDFRGVLSTNWTYDAVYVTGRLNYYGEYTSYNAVPPPAGTPDLTTQSFGAELSFDLEAGITLQDRFRIAVGAENLFDNYPDRELRNIYPATGAQASGRLYNDASPLGYLGGFWYVRVGMDL
ncbi:TonB-dependent siderophore receptor [Croceicoccus sp. YJ47]|uniref:TonB-dependent receptor plug domain-containing protein n=1 Tax=Croceicoccus sp. YJ47 TaxID=2798724 RepID=UPI0019234989|nr:TonB-dependent receptor [Croceicoccus sp. YJ47]QQN74258.1 TonB-dependent receptor [Croceicoccus sp. YJ47]